MNRTIVQEGAAGELIHRAAQVWTFQQFLKGMFSRVLLPAGGRAAVGEDYWSFSFWNFVRNITSGAGAVLGTQALLRAVGIGSGYAAAGSASLNWVLKDGLGRLGAIGAATAVGNRYDSDPKSFFLLGDLAFELGVGIELVAPLFPQWFLLIGSLANALKSMSYMMRLPPRAAILKSFARRENVGDLSAKANSQEVVAGMLGMLLGLSLSSAIGDSSSKVALAFVATLTTVGLSSYLSLRPLCLATLNWARCRILMDRFVRDDRVAAPQEVNVLEPMPSFPGSRLENLLRSKLDVRFGCPLNEVAENAGVLRANAFHFLSERYILCLSPPRRALGGLLHSRASIRIAIAETATAEDSLKAMLHSEKLQVLLERRFSPQGASTSGGGGGGAAAAAAASAAGAGPAFPPPEEAAALIRLSLEQTNEAFPAALARWKEAGWNTSVALWSPSFVCDWSGAAALTACELPRDEPGGGDEAEEEAERAAAAAIAEGAEDGGIVTTTTRISGGGHDERRPPQGAPPPPEEGLRRRR